MFEYVFYIPIVLKPKGSPVNELYTSVAKYSSDPGVKVGEFIRVSNWIWGTHSDKPISFEAMVTKIQKVILPQKSIDKMQTSIFLELTDKDELIRIKEIMQRLNPGVFEEVEFPDDPFTTAFGS